MGEVERYDVLVFGSGTGGKLVGWTMAKEGKRTAVVERKMIGGACPNVACLPSKNVIHSAKVASLVGRHREFGIETGKIAINMAEVYARKQKMVDEIVEVHLEKYHQSGSELILGEGRFIAPRTLQVALRDGGGRTLTADQVFVNLGTHATIPDIPGLRAAAPMSHVELLELQRTPEHLIVLGGGYVGLELGQAMRRLGSRVTVVERGLQLLSREDADFAQAVLDLFRDEGIDVLLHAEVRKVNGRSGDRVTLQLQGERGTHTIEGTDLLAAMGRTPNTQGIGLETAGIEITDQGHIRLNDRLETTAPNVWAIGECAGSPYFTHVSEDDFYIIHANLNGGSRSTRDRLVPNCIFIDPPLARVGLSELEARENGIPYRLATLPMDEVWRPWTLSEKRGFMKALIDARSDRILGFGAFGPEAGELMGTVQTAMLGGIPYPVLRDAVYAHPTMNEGLKGLFAGVPQTVPDRVGKRATENVHA